MKRRNFVQSISSLGIVSALGPAAMAADGSVAQVSATGKGSGLKIAKLEFIRLADKTGKSRSVVRQRLKTI